MKKAATLKHQFLDKNAPGKECPSCGEIFHRDNRCTKAYWEKAIYCSRECYGKSIPPKANAKRRPIQEEFEKHFVKTDGCWEWTWLKDKDGYGLFPYAGKMYRAHVLALRLVGRSPAPGQFGCHDCDNPGCVRPSHLKPGTQKQNMADAVARNRMRTGERVHFSSLTEDIVRKIRMADGTHTKIAKDFGVSRSNVTLIRNRKTWKHVV